MHGLGGLEVEAGASEYLLDYSSSMLKKVVEGSTVSMTVRTRSTRCDLSALCLAKTDMTGEQHIL
jgi:hypothetical protein